MQKYVTFMEKESYKSFLKNKNYQKVRNHCHYAGKYTDAAHRICNLKFNVRNKIPVVFNNSSNYDYYFIIKELANQYKEQLECIELQKYRTISVLMEKEVTKIDKDGNESVATISTK